MELWQAILSDDGNRLLTVSFTTRVQVWEYNSKNINNQSNAWVEVGDLTTAMLDQGILQVLEVDVSAEGNTVGIVSPSNQGATLLATAFQYDASSNAWLGKGNPIEFHACTISDHTFLSGDGNHWLILFNCNAAEVLEYSHDLGDWSLVGVPVVSTSDKASISNDGQRIAVYGTALEVYEFDTLAATWQVMGSTIATNFGQFALSGSGTRLLFADETDGTLRVLEWNGVTWNEMGGVLLQGYVYDFVAISTDGNRVVARRREDFVSPPVATIYADYSSDSGNWQVHETTFATIPYTIDFVTSFAAASKNRITTSMDTEIYHQVWELT